MKAVNLLKQHNLLYDKLQDYIAEKLSLDDISNDHFFFVCMGALIINSKKLKLIIDAVGEEHGENTLVNRYFFDANASEIDDFMVTGKIQEKLDWRSLTKLASNIEEPEEEPCQHCLEETQEEHIRSGH